MNNEKIFELIESDFDTVEKQADAGDAAAQYWLAKLYLKNNNLPKKMSDEVRYRKAFAYSLKSAAQGYPRGLFQVACIYMNRTGIQTAITKEESDNLAVYYYEQAYEKGRNEALINLGVIYQKIPNIQNLSGGERMKKAFEYYQLAAECKIPQGYYNLACLYFDRKGIDSSLSKQESLNRAFEWVTKAAKAKLRGVDELFNKIKKAKNNYDFHQKIAMARGRGRIGILAQISSEDSDRNSVLGQNINKVDNDGFEIPSLPSITNAKKRGRQEDCNNNNNDEKRDENLQNEEDERNVRGKFN